MSAVDHDLEPRGVTKRFGSFVAINDVSLVVQEGQFVCLPGPSGCGKTTTLRLIAGLEEADAGEIRIAGRCLRRACTASSRGPSLPPSHLLSPTGDQAR